MLVRQVERPLCGTYDKMVNSNRWSICRKRSTPIFLMLCCLNYLGRQLEDAAIQGNRIVPGA